MILTDKTLDNLTRPRRMMFGEEWFIDPDNFKNEFFGAVLDGRRPQPFPSKDAAANFAKNHVERHGGYAEVIDLQGNVLLYLGDKDAG